MYRLAPDLTLFQQSSLSYSKDGAVSAMPLQGNGSGDLTSLVGADGFAELPRGKDHFRKDEVYRWWSY